MKRYLFTRELFRSTVLAAAHLAIFVALMLGYHFHVVTLGICATLWLGITLYNFCARIEELRFGVRATRRYMQAIQESQLPNDDEPDDDKGLCVDCLESECVSRKAVAIVAGPDGPRPVCLSHARAQAVANGQEADKLATK